MNKTILIAVVGGIAALLLGVWLRDDKVTSLALVGAPVPLLGAFLASRRSG